MKLNVFHTNDEIQQADRDSPRPTHTHGQTKGVKQIKRQTEGETRDTCTGVAFGQTYRRASEEVDDPQGSSRGDSHLSSRLSPIAINAANVLLLASGGGAGCAGVLSSVHRKSLFTCRRE